MTGLNLIALRVPIYNVALTCDLPPQMVLLPLCFPLSRLKGATPTSAAISFRFSVPSSGRAAIRVQEMTGPMPGVLVRIVSFSFQRGLFLMVREMSLSIFFRASGR